MLGLPMQKAGAKLGPDQLGSLDPGRINSDQPGSTRIDLNYNSIKEKGYYYLFIMKI